MGQPICYQGNPNASALAAIPTMSVIPRPPSDPAKGALPKLNTPPSEANKVIAEVSRRGIEPAGRTVTPDTRARVGGHPDDGSIESEAPEGAEERS